MNNWQIILRLMARPIRLLCVQRGNRSILIQLGLRVRPEQHIR